jgi:hypothetical protein
MGRKVCSKRFDQKVGGRMPYGVRPDGAFKMHLSGWVERDLVDDRSGEWLPAELVPKGKTDGGHVQPCSFPSESS